MDLLIAIIILITCYFVGSSIEKNHYINIKAREIAMIKRPYISFQKNVLNKKNIIDSKLVSGCAVIACDRFKFFLSNIISFFGGNLSSYESVLDRARREALLRMREEGIKCHARIITNVKLETMMINNAENGNQSIPQVCVLAYGTAVNYE